MENINSQHDNVKPFKRFAKWFLLIIIAIIIIYIVIIFVSPQNREWLSMLIGQKLDQRSLDNYKKQIQSDKYGGTTPLETYKMFVEALKQQDIDLAVKYFVQGKQGEYKKFFEAIKQEGKWDLMMADVSTSKNNTRGSQQGPNAYQLDIVDSNNFLVTTVYIVIPCDINGQPISDIWKIESF